jgi:hypothetical protein
MDYAPLFEIWEVHLHVYPVFNAQILGAPGAFSARRACPRDWAP